MRLLSLTRTLPAPVADVYATLIAVDLLPEWASSVESVELIDPLPIREGTRFRETRRHNDRATTVEMTVRDIVPDTLLRISAIQGGAVIVSAWHLEPAPDGTSVRFEMEMMSDRLWVRVVVQLLSLFTRGVMRRCIEDDLDDLNRFLTGDAGDDSDEFGPGDAEASDDLGDHDARRR